MRKVLLVYSAAATLAALASICVTRLAAAENRRLRNNQEALSREIEHYTTRLGESAASVQALQLRCGEYERLRRADAAKIKELGIRLRRLESVSKSITLSDISVAAPLTDTVVAGSGRAAGDTLRIFRWHDAWTEIAGRIDGASIECTVHSTDTLRQIVHRVPRRFLFIRWGTKCVRQEIVSSNPHTHILYSEYVDFDRAHRRKKGRQAGEAL